MTSTLTAERTPPALTTAAPKTPALRSRSSTLFYIAIFVLTIYFLLPVWWLVVASTKSNSALYRSPALWFSSENSFFHNIAATFSQDGGTYAHWLLNTAIYALVGGVGSLAVSTLAGFAFAKYDFPGKRVIFAGLLGILMIPLTVLVIPQYLLMSTIHFVNTPLAVIVPSMINPLGVYLIRVFAQDTVPQEVMESARMDGASELRIFWSIAVPILRPVLATVLLFSIVAIWNNYFLPLVMLSDNNLYPLTVGLAHWYSQAEATAGATTPLFNLVITGSLIGVVPLIVSFIVLQRQWVGGLTLGSLR